jgi:hypothetical protein
MKRINRRNFLKNTVKTIVGVAFYSVIAKLPRTATVKPATDAKKGRYYKKITG